MTKKNFSFELVQITKFFFIGMEIEKKIDFQKST